MAELPAFKPSGQGGQVDLKNIITSQAVAWGGYKAKLRKKYGEVAGTFFFEGEECYNDVDITYGVYDENSGVYELMELFGFEDESMQELAEQKSDSNNNIEKMFIDYNAEIDKEEDSFEAMIDFFVDEIKNFDYMTLSLRNVLYAQGTAEPSPIGPRQVGLSYVTINDIAFSTPEYIDPDYPPPDTSEPDWFFTQFIDNPNTDYLNTNPSLPVQGRPNIKRIMNNLGMIIYKDGVNITSNYSSEFVQFCAFIAIVESTMVTEANQRISRTLKNVGEEYCDFVGSNGYDDLCAYNNPQVFWNELVVSNTYTFNNMNRNVLYSRYGYYVSTCVEQNSCSNNATDEQKEEKIPSYSHAALLWDFVGPQVLSNVVESTNGLFKLVKYGCDYRFDLITGAYIEYCDYEKIHMTVEGLKVAQPDSFGFYVSQFMNIRYEQKEESWLKRFIGGIIKAFLSLVDALIGIFLQVPVLKQLVEVVLSVIGTLFGVSGDNARMILGQIIISIVIAVVAPYLLSSLGLGASVTMSSLLPGLSGGMSTLVTYSSYAMQVYNAGMQGKMIGEAKDQALASANRDYELRKAQEEMNKVKEAFGGTMGSAADHASKDMMMYEIMFNPFYYFPQAIPAEETPQSGIIQ